MRKLYRYTLLKTDGTEQDLGTRDHEMFLHYMQKAVGGPLELIPPAYYSHQKWGQCTVYGDEEGRFKSKPDNLHFHMFPNGQFMPPVVGDCLRVARVPAEVATPT